MVMGWWAAWKRSIVITVAAAAAMVAGCAHRERAASGAAPSVANVTTNEPPQKGTHMTAKGTYTKPSEAELRNRLSPLEYEVTQNDATEPSFRNKFWNNHEPGLYVDVVSGEPLFSSTDKFDSGTGWPSFTKPVDPARVKTHTDHKLLMARTEVRSSAANSHLGHVFDDGPKPQGLRYCINSAALRFVPAKELEAQGYGEYRALFGGSSQESNAHGATAASADAANACAAPKPGEQPGCEATLETAILAGGCFWGMEDILRKIPGVLETEAGYTGGAASTATYENVHNGQTGHAESVRIVFDPKKISYEDLLEKWFFRMHDPTTKNRQGNDVGTQYRSAIFVTTPAQREAAQRVIQRVDASKRWKAPVVTEIADAGSFTRAEEYHQKYLEKHPGGYTCHYLRD